jgi:two-component system nitrogen regulation sensor histidine kinase NtrY
MATLKSKRSRELVRLYFAAGLAALSYTFFKLYRLLSFSEESALGASRWGGLMALGLANTIAISLIFFIMVRALAKVFFERRSGVLGSRIGAKLVAAFLAVGIVPSAILFVMGRSYILKNIERWFSPETMRLINDGGEISSHYKKERLDGVQRDAEIAAALNRAPQTVIAELGLDYCSNSKQSVVKTGPAPPMPLGDGGAWTFDAGADGAWYFGRSGPWVVGRLVPRDVQESLARLERRREEARQIGGLGDTLVGYADNVLLFMTLLTIFAAVWTGLTLSKTIAEPVRALAKAAKRVGMGDLDVALPEEGADELAILSRSFNAMTRDLKAANKEVEQHTQRIDRQRAYLNDLMDALPVGVISLSATGRLRTCNNTAQSWLGMVPFDPEKDYWRDAAWLSRLGDLPDLLSQLRQKGKPMQEELRIGGEGEGRPVKAMIVPLSGGGELAVLEDLSLLAQAEKRAAWQEIARRMAHEVKSPLAPIKLTAQRLLRRVKDGRLEAESVSQGAETILSEVDSLARLVDSFTSFAKLPAPQPSPCDACELMRQVYALYLSAHAAHGKINLQMLLPDCPIPANWDGDMIKRALINFADNAIHAVQGQGNIMLEAALAGNKARLSVRDNGPGVPWDARAQLFEPYFSTKRHGTGLGLAIAKKIAQDHGGDAVYEDTGDGSMFYLELPVAP